MKHFQKLDLRQKIIVSMTILLISTSVLIFVLVTISSQKFMKNQSIDMALQQLKTASYHVERLINSTEDASYQISANSWIQSYLTSSSGSTKNYTLYERSANEVISNQLNSNSNFDFIALLDTNQERCLYTGIVWTIPNFSDKIHSLYQTSQPLENGYIRYSLTRNIFHPKEYSFYFFQPIYNRYHLNQEIGLLIFGISESNVQAISQRTPSTFNSIYVINDQGYILSSDQINSFLNKYPYFSKIQDQAGYFQSSNDNMVIFNHIESLDWYLVNEIPINQLQNDYRSLIFFITIGIIISLIICVFFAYMISNTIYQPLQTILLKMADVSQGILDVRISSNYCGEDIKKINDGFNHMLDKINDLISQVKEEQHQIEMIRFNALQSQIQPHFLYNTLDSIHWQALYNQDKEVAQMVKYLAKYYRICLSQGNDIISLQNELDMIQAYMKIQNIRYDNLIQYHIDVSSKYKSIAIPKLSLQPLIENAIYHGFRPKKIQRGQIWITGFQNQNDFILTISDDGIGMTPDEINQLNHSISIFNEKQGYGLNNVHRRIEICYGSKYGLHFYLDHRQYVNVEIRLPLKFITNIERI